MIDLMAEVTFTPNASKRTKDRIKEHGPIFKMESFDNPPCMNGVPSVFLRSKDGWFGWLIKDEISCRTPSDHLLTNQIQNGKIEEHKRKGNYEHCRKST